MIKTYLGLPRRITGINLSRRHFQEIGENFSALLDALEQHASDRLDGIDLGDIEWYHRLRNQLYHQGNGLTVERDKVVVYSELARVLFRNLFEFDLQIPQPRAADTFGAFMLGWAKLEKVVTLAVRHSAKRSTSLMLGFKELLDMGWISETTERELDSLRKIRNEVVHGGKDTLVITPEHVEKLTAVTKQLESHLSAGDMAKLENA
jgi:hypothetical protein